MHNPSSSTRSWIPLLTTSMAVLAPLLFILGLVVGININGETQLSADSLSSWLSAIATVAIAVLTFILAKETWYLREAQNQQLREMQKESIRPDVGVSIEGSQVGMNFINAHITNLGKGIARNVRFQILNKQGAALTPGSDVVADKFFKLGVFKVGIQSIGINQKISSYIFNFHQLSAELGGKLFEPYFKIIISFEDVEGNPYENEFTFDFAQFEGISEVGGDPIYNMSNEIKKIREQLGKSLQTNNNRIGVDIFTARERAAEQEETRLWLQEQIERSRHENNGSSAPQA